MGDPCTGQLKLWLDNKFGVDTGGTRLDSLGADPPIGSGKIGCESSFMPGHRMPPLELSLDTHLQQTLLDQHRPSKSKKWRSLPNSYHYMGAVITF